MHLHFVCLAQKAQVILLVSKHINYGLSNELRSVNSLFKKQRKLHLSITPSFQSVHSLDRLRGRKELKDSKIRVGALQRTTWQAASEKTLHVFWGFFLIITTTTTTIIIHILEYRIRDKYFHCGLKLYSKQHHLVLVMQHNHSINTGLSSFLIPDITSFSRISGLFMAVWKGKP